jgi:hypothetical protein
MSAEGCRTPACFVAFATRLRTLLDGIVRLDRVSVDELDDLDKMTPTTMTICCLL